MASVVAALIAIAKAIPIISQYLSVIVTEWQKHQISQIEDNYEQREKLRDFLIHQLSTAKDDNERITAFRLLARIK